MGADDIAKALGLRKQGLTFHGACPCCGYKSGFAVEDQKGTTLVRCHAGGCAQADVIGALRQQGLWGGEGDKEWTPPVRRAPVSDDGAKAQAMTKAARDIWRQTMPADGTPLAAYLRHRGITLPIPPTLRYLAACRHTGTGLSLPAMVAAVVVAPGREVVAIHRTYLLSDGRGKAPVSPDKMTLGPKSGGAVRLAAAGPVLIVGEGVETTLSAMQATGVPGWSALDAGNLRNLILPALPIAAEVTIAADNDTNGVGQAAARAAAARWVAEGRRVRIALPPIPGTDWNDLLKDAEHA